MTSSERRFVRAIARLVMATALIGIALPALADVPTAADLETARALVKEGRALRAAGDLRAALEKFKAGHALAQTPITALELARTHEMLGDLVEAREICLGVARLAVESDETERSAIAREEAAKLAQALPTRIASLVVHVMGAPPGAAPEVRIDDQVVPAAALGEPRKVNPRSHIVLVSLEGYETARAYVELAEGESKTIELPLSKTPYDQPVAIMPAPVRPNRGRDLLIAGGATMAGIGVAVGSVAGLGAWVQSTSLDSKCPGKKCLASAFNDVREARSWGDVASVSFGAAGVGLAFALYGLVALKPTEPATTAWTPWIGVGSVGVAGKF